MMDFCMVTSARENTGMPLKTTLIPRHSSKMATLQPKSKDCLSIEEDIHHMCLPCFRSNAKESGQTHRYARHNRAYSTYSGPLLGRMRDGSFYMYMYKTDIRRPHKASRH